MINSKPYSGGDTIIEVGPPSKKAKQQKKEKALHDKVRNQASTVENCREEIKTLHEDMHDVQQQDQERARQEKKRVVREEELLARADKAVNNQSARTDRHDRFRAKQMEETRRLKTGFKEKLATVVEEKETEAITGKLKTKQKLAAVEEKGAQSLEVSKKKAASVQINQNVRLL